MSLTINRRDGVWWIDGDDEPIGPYYTKREAQEDLRGLKEFYKHEDYD